MLASHGATADYMAALSAQLTCGDECRVIGPAGYGLNSLRRWASRDPWCVLVLGAGAANGASALRWLLRRRSKGATLTTVINDGYGDADNILWELTVGAGGRQVAGVRKTQAAAGNVCPY
jgi:hypothetical protein